MRNKNILITVILLALILIIGGFFWWAQTSNQEIDQTPNNNGIVDENIINEDTEDEDINDRSTIVAMNGEFTPEELTVFPGQEIRVVNNENSDLSLQFRDTEIGPIPSGGNGTFRAPMEAGSFEYRSSINANARFTLVVEI